MRGLPPKRLISSLHHYYKCTTAWFHVKATMAEEWSAWSQRLYHKPSSTEIATIVGDLFSYNGCHPRPSSLVILAGLQNTSLWSVQIAKSGQCLLCVYVFSFFLINSVWSSPLTHTYAHTQYSIQRLLFFFHLGVFSCCPSCCFPQSLHHRILILGRGYLLLPPLAVFLCDEASSQVDCSHWKHVNPA